MVEEKKNWRIYAGMSGGFNSAGYIRTINSTLNEANNEAYREAVESYQNYEGSVGLFDINEALEENPDLTEEELQEMEQEDIESWIEYWVVEETDKNKDDED